MSALTKQSGGSHYKDLQIQPVEYIHANELGYFEGNVLKYITRWKSKGGIGDLEKAKHYIELLIELETEKQAVDAMDKTANQKFHSIESDGWIQWQGGECPVDKYTRVHVRYRCGDEDTSLLVAGGLDWIHQEWNAFDIIAYRVVK